MNIPRATSPPQCLSLPLKKLSYHIMNIYASNLNRIFITETFNAADRMCLLNLKRHKTMILAKKKHHKQLLIKAKTTGSSNMLRPRKKSHCSVQAPMGITKNRNSLPQKPITDKQRQ
jgi:hypothetical protein